MKTRLLVCVNSLLAVIIAMLGFSSCEGSSEMREEYGCPSVHFHVIGKITDENGKPIQGIKISVKDSNGAYPIEAKKGTLTDLSSYFYTHSDQNGDYATCVYENVAISSAMKVIITDEDGAANGGEFRTDSVEAKSMQMKKVEKGDGNWYSGAYELTANKQLKKKNAE